MCLRLFYLEKMEKAKKLMEEELSISEICILLLQTQGNSTIQLKMGSICFWCSSFANLWNILSFNHYTKRRHVLHCDSQDHKGIIYTWTTAFYAGNL